MTVEDWHAVLAREPVGRLRHDQGGARAPARARLRAHRQHQLDRRRDRAVGQANYAASKSGLVRPHQDDGTGDCPQGDHGQLRRAGLHRHRHVRGGARDGSSRSIAKIAMQRAGRRPRGRARGCFLLEDDACYITGQVLGVTAGVDMQVGASRPSSTAAAAASSWRSTPPTTPPANAATRRGRQRVVLRRATGALRRPAPRRAARSAWTAAIGPEGAGIAGPLVPTRRWASRPRRPTS